MKKNIGLDWMGGLIQETKNIGWEKEKKVDWKIIFREKKKKIAEILNFWI